MLLMAKNSQMKSCYCYELTGMSSGLEMLLLESSAASKFATSKLFLGASKPVSMDESKNEYL